MYSSWEETASEETVPKQKQSFEFKLAILGLEGVNVRMDELPADSDLNDKNPIKPVYSEPPIKSVYTDSPIKPVYTNPSIIPANYPDLCSPSKPISYIPPHHSVCTEESPSSVEGQRMYEEIIIGTGVRTQEEYEGNGSSRISEILESRREMDWTIEGENWEESYYATLDEDEVVEAKSMSDF